MDDAGMARGFRITLKAGDRIVVNGAALKVDRKVGVELLNDVAFLLEQHIMMPDEATTPLRRLYLEIQSILTEPAVRNEARARAMDSMAAIQSSALEQRIVLALKDAQAHLGEDRPLEALKTIRAVLPLDVPPPKPCPLLLETATASLDVANRF